MTHPELASAPSPLGTALKILIVADNASERFGGEAILPLHYFRFLRARKIDVRLVVHERVKNELLQNLPAADHERIYFIPETWMHTWLWRAGNLLPKKVAGITFYWLVNLLTGLSQRTLVCRLVVEQGLDIVHQPIPVSPKQPSLIYDVGAPVIFGPMNGGMSFPPAFADLDSPLDALSTRLGRALSGLMNYVLPGKRKAALLLVANARTQASLPPWLPRSIQVLELVENGIDPALWKQDTVAARPTEAPEIPQFVFIGRFERWKGLEFLIEAIARVLESRPVDLCVIGDGSERSRLEALVESLGVQNHVTFVGFIRQQDCPAYLARARALVLPSLYECGGAVVLEAMAMSVPVIATNWGGPADYITEDCGILVEPSSRESLISGLAQAMIELADDEERCRVLGKKGRERVLRLFNWESKVDTMLEIYQQVVDKSKNKNIPETVS